MLQIKKSLGASLPAIIVVALLVLIRVVSFQYLPSTDKSDERLLFMTIYYLTVTALILFIGNYLFSKFLNWFLHWKKYPIFRFFLQMILGTALSLLAINLIYHSVKFEFTDSPPHQDQVILMNMYASALLLPLYAFFFGFKFLQAWRKSELESEQLQKENTRSQLMTLKNHLDPHFLFNNLNILSSLMDKDLELSKSYLDKFAEVYRQILKTEYSDLTTVEEELKLIESYIYLLKIRFKDQVFFNIDIEKSKNLKALPPLTMQMLIENAIKHNMATVERPITINIYTQADTLIVENNLQKKKYLEREREATGIENIKKRFAFFTDKTVAVKETDAIFSVTVPLIDIEYVD